MPLRIVFILLALQKIDSYDMNNPVLCFIIYWYCCYDGELFHIHQIAEPKRLRGSQLASIQRCQIKEISICRENPWSFGSCSIYQAISSFPHHYPQPSWSYLCSYSAEWDDQMPFPVIERSRYWAYAGGITSLLVKLILITVLLLL